MVGRRVLLGIQADTARIHRMVYTRGVTKYHFLHFPSLVMDVYLVVLEVVLVVALGSDMVIERATPRRIRAGVHEGGHVGVCHDVEHGDLDGQLRLHVPQQPPVYSMLEMKARRQGVGPKILSTALCKASEASD